VDGDAVVDGLQALPEVRLPARLYVSEPGRRRDGKFVACAKKRRT
jgi:hypothetical protein